MPDYVHMLDPDTGAFLSWSSPEAPRHAARIRDLARRSVDLREIFRNVPPTERDSGVQGFRLTAFLLVAASLWGDTSLRCHTQGRGVVLSFAEGYVLDLAATRRAQAQYDPTDFARLVAQCDRDVLVLPLRLVFAAERVAHANTLIVNRRTRTVYVFEPNGMVARWGAAVMKAVKAYVMRLVLKLPHGAYQLVDTVDFCPYFGPQLVRGDGERMCAGWAGWVATAVVLNPQRPPDEIVLALMGSAQPEQLQKDVRQFTAWAQHTIAWAGDEQDSYVIDQRPRDIQALVCALESARAP